MKLKLTEIKRDVKLSPRDGTNPDVVTRYMECLDQMPPIVVFKIPDEEKYLLVDGWHRYVAAEQLGHESIMAEQAKYGTRDEAYEYALLANLKHGLPLTRKEKRRVIEAFLKLHPERANKWIGEDLGCRNVTVEAARLRLESMCQIDTYEMLTQRDGTQYPRTIEQPPKAKEDESSEAEDESDTSEPPEEPGPSIGPFELNQVYHLDCLDGFKALPEESLSLVFADPPYNLGKNYGAASFDSIPDNAYFSWCMQWFLAIWRTLVPGGAVYLMQYPEAAAKWKQQLDPLFTFRRWITWVYPSNIGHSGDNWRRSHRAILYYTKGSSPLFFDGEADPQPYKNPNDRRVAHLGKEGTTPYDWWLYDLVKNVSPDKTEWPNQLPAELVRRIILTSCPGDGVVCDPFIGSGTTAMAAIKAERAWIGFDIEARACQITKERTASEESGTFENLIREARRQGEARGGQVDSPTQTEGIETAQPLL